MSHDSRKKRKANDGGRAATDGAHDVSTGTSQLDRMENIMVRVEEKLATVSSLESRCEQLGKKCSSLENMLESVLQSTKEQTEGSATTLKSMKEHIDKKLKYHEMLIQNQKWEYSARVRTKNELERWGYEADDAAHIYETSQNLKESTEAMRRGKFPNEGRTVSLHTSDDAYEFDDLDIINDMSVHWREFAAALKQFKPVFDLSLSDDVSTCIKFGTLILNQEMTHLIKEALVNLPFKALYIENDPRIYDGMFTISSIMCNNYHLKKLDIYEVQEMGAIDRVKLSSVIRHHPSLVDVCMTRCFSGGVGNEFLRTLLRTPNELKLEKLQMPSNNITSDATAPLLDYLATNTRLKKLDLTGNDLDDSDAISLANALRSNTTLRSLFIAENNVGRVGEEAFRDAVRDETSLNSVAASNHICMIECDHESELFNDCEVRETNRARKIYALLDSRHETISNVQHFDDIDLKLLPNILEAVQNYSNASNENLNTSIVWQRDHYVAALSIVYEVMRKWDKAFPLYKSLGGESVEN